MSLLVTMAQQMVNQLSPDERVNAAHDVAISMIRDLSAQDRASLTRTLMLELLRDLTPAERDLLIGSIPTRQEVG